MIVTQRLELVPATPALTRAALAGPAALTVNLGAVVPPTWPPEYLDPASLEFTLERLAQGPEQAGWWLHFVGLKAGATGPTLIGSAGYCGPAAADGTVEVGYGIVSDQRRRGYAAVGRLVAETLPELAGSIGVLRTCGFDQHGEGSAPGVIRFELLRATYEARSTIA